MDKEFQSGFMNNTLALAVAGWVMGCFIIFAPGYWSAITVWSASDAFTHCFFVIPLSAYFAWQNRGQFLGEVAKPSWLPAPLIVGAVFIWALGYAGQISALTHIAIFALLPLGIWMILGDKIARILWFPLIFILFSIPIGDELIPLFQEITADISVWLLRLSGVPVFRDGLYISIPNGRFVVAEACSGVRFFIASVCLGAVFSYVSYKSIFKRTSFFIFAIILPIVANGFRAYGIMMIGHLSNMEHAVGADHLIYGWVFFAFIIIVMILVGNLWADKIEIKGAAEPITSHVSWGMRYSALVYGLFLLPLVCVMAWKQLMSPAIVDSPRNTTMALVLPFIEAENPQSNWQPKFVGATESMKGVLNDGVEVYVAWYLGTAAEGELVYYSNQVFDEDNFSQFSESVAELPTASGRINGAWAELKGSLQASRTIYYYYLLPGQAEQNEIKVKLRQALNVMMGRGNEGALLAFSVESGSRAQRENKIIKAVQANHGLIKQALKLN